MSDQAMAESVAHFLYWTGYLDYEDSIESVTIYTDGSQFEAGTSTFRRLKDSLERLHPGWRTWNTNYQKTKP